MYVPSYPLGLRDNSFFGESLFRTPNPPFGAVFTYYLPERVARLQRAVLGASDAVKDVARQLALVRKALDATPGADTTLMDDVRAMENRVKDIDVILSGDRVVAGYNEPTPPSIVDRVQAVVAGEWSITSPPTNSHQRSYLVAAATFGPLLAALRTLVDVDLKALADRLEKAGGPWTPGRIPTWPIEK